MYDLNKIHQKLLHDKYIKLTALNVNSTCLLIIESKVFYPTYFTLVKIFPFFTLSMLT